MRLGGAMRSMTTLTVVGLAACGGGGGSDPAGPATPTSVTLTGTAAQGAALPDATVTVKCAGGTGTATTGSDGKYTLTISGATLPCALKVVGTNGATYHSLLSGSTSGTYTANLSPLTELLVAIAAGAEPATYFTDFAAGTAPSAATVAAAIDALKTLTAGIIDLSGVNPISDALIAANGGSAGNALDQNIETLIAALNNAQTTLAEVTTAIVANPSVPDPIKTILSPVATSCSALRSGKYRMINPAETDPNYKYQVITVDAVGLKITESDGNVSTVIADGDCQFTVADAVVTNKVMVSPSGVLVVYSSSTAQPTNPALRGLSLGLPEQSLPISELTGTWNMASFDPATGSPTPGYVGGMAQLSFGAAGQITAISDCLGLNACVADAGPFPALTARTGGGFERIANGVSEAQLFLFKALNGKKVFVIVNESGELLVGSVQEAFNTLPVVGAVTNFKEFTWNGNGSLSDLTDQRVTVTAVDATAKTVTRIRASDGRVDTLGIDKPRDGLRYRAPNSCTFNGIAGNCSQTVQLVLQGMGITFSVSVGTVPTNAFFSISVNKPS